MDLFITHCFSSRVIGTRRFHKSQPITPADALRLLRAQPHDVTVSHLEYRDVLDYINACAG